MAGTIKEKFIEATNRWYEYVGRDHHKDRDCHWFVSKTYDYAYGDEPKEAYYEIRHFGYIADDQEFFGDTEDEVLQKATDFINEFILTGDKEI